ncbi:hypothetical protein Tco_0361215 [Tanacetum coccineum]
MDAKGTKFRKLSTMNKKQMKNPKVQLDVAAMHEVPLYKSPDYMDADMAQCSGHIEALEFIPASTLERFAKMGWEQLLDFDSDKIYRRIVIDWTASLSRKGDELTGIVDGKPYTISPTIIRDLLKVDTRTDLPYARFNQADFQTITDENEIRWLEACKTVFGRELDKNVVISYLEMTPLVKILWGIGLWTFHPVLMTRIVFWPVRSIFFTQCIQEEETIFSKRIDLDGLLTSKVERFRNPQRIDLDGFAHLMIDDIWSMYEDEYQKTIPRVYYLSEILTRLGAVSQDELIEVVDLSHRQITRSSFRDLRFSETPTRYIIYDRVLKQQVTFLKKAIEVEAPPQSPPHLMPIPNPHADKTNNSKDLINTQLSQSQKQLDDMMSIVSNMQKHMEQQAFEAKRRDQERELLEQTREKRAQEREKQAEEREKRAEIQAHAMTNNLQNLINKQSEEHEKMIMIVKNMQKQMECQAAKAERREQAREKHEEERETQAEVKAHAMVKNLQNLINKQAGEHEKMIMIVKNMQKQMEDEASKAERREQAREKREEERETQAEVKAHAMAERRELAREKWEVEREKQAEIKAHAMESNLQNLIGKQFQEQYEKMTMIVNDKLKQMECQALKAERREEEREKQEQERETALPKKKKREAQIKAHAMENSLQNMISKQFQEKHEKMIMLVNNMKKHMESQALAAECREQKLEKQEEEREKRADIRAHAII